MLDSSKSLFPCNQASLNEGGVSEADGGSNIKAALSTWDEAARGTTHFRAGMPQSMAVRTSFKP